MTDVDDDESVEALAYWGHIEGQQWFVVENDYIGGWAIANTPKRTSELDHREYEFPIADCLTYLTAEHVVRLHNERIGAHNGTL